MAADMRLTDDITVLRNNGFTLVELLVVISVISLLMAILLPALGKARASAKRVHCMSNLKQIGVAMQSYLDDNRDIFPHDCNIAYAITDPNDSYYLPPITKFLGPLLKEPKVFICAADTDKKYYLKNNCGISYAYRGQGSDGLGGITINQSFDARQGIKEKNIEVMNDFDPFHPGFTGTFRKRVGQKNFLYADWHVGNYKNQDQ